MAFWNRKNETQQPETTPTIRRVVRPASNSQLNQISENLMHSFMKVKEDMQTQKQWITYLHEDHKELKNKHEAHKQKTTDHAENTNKWIEYLNHNTKKQQKDFQELEKYIREAIGAYNEHIVELYNKYNDLITETEKAKSSVKETLVEHQKGLTEEIKHDIHVEMHDNLKNAIELEKNHMEAALAKRLKADLKEELQEEMELVIARKLEDLPRAPEPIIEHKETIIEHEPVIEYTAKQHLTNPELKLLNFLLNQPDPLNYHQIGIKTGHSINTVRVNMNLLKKKGFIEENMLPSGVKLFNVKNKEKIKKMYNLEVIH
jgi:hypothetical protein